jgi:hypothetical protein
VPRAAGHRASSGGRAGRFTCPGSGILRPLRLCCVVERCCRSTPRGAWFCWYSVSVFRSASNTGRTYQRSHFVHATYSNVQLYALYLQMTCKAGFHVCLYLRRPVVGGGGGGRGRLSHVTPFVPHASASAPTPAEEMLLVHCAHTASSSEKKNRDERRAD